jgi:hypothetical protein
VTTRSTTDVSTRTRVAAVGDVERAAPGRVGSNTLPASSWHQFGRAVSGRGAVTTRTSVSAMVCAATRSQRADVTTLLLITNGIKGKI